MPLPQHPSRRPWQRPGRRSTRMLAGSLGLLLAAGLAACSSEAMTDQGAGPSSQAVKSTSSAALASPAVAADQTFEIDATAGMKYQLPSPTAPAGVVAVTLVNKDPQMPHMAQLFKLHPGVTMKQFSAELLSPGGEGALAPIADPAGGPDGVGPGHSLTVTLDLAPSSTYAVICSVPGADGTPHYAHGMITSFTTAANTQQGSLPATDQTITLSDFQFKVAPTLDWSKPVTVVNSGHQPHEVQILGPAQGKTIADVKAYLMAKPGATPPGPPPYQAYGGVAATAPGAKQAFTPGLPAGEYLLVCFVTDPTTHLPHFMMGMMSHVTVP